MRFYIAVFVVSGLLFVPAANAASCPGADPCPWTQVASFGDVGAGEFRAPYGIGADASGNLYVVENDRHRVQKLDPNGAVLKTFGGPGSGDGELYYPYDIAVDPAGGGVYVTDNSNFRVEKYDTSGQFVSAWGWGVSDGTNAYQVCTSGCRAGLAGAGTGQFSSATGIATEWRERVRRGLLEQAHSEVRPRGQPGRRVGRSRRAEAAGRRGLRRKGLRWHGG